MSHKANTSFRIEEKLTGVHKNFFDQNGFIHFKNFISREQTQELLKEIQDVERHLLRTKAKK